MPENTQQTQQTQPAAPQNRPRRLVARPYLGREIAGDAYLDAEIKLYCRVSRGIWAENEEDLQQGFLTVQNSLASQCTAEESVALDRALMSLVTRVSQALDDEIKDVREKRSKHEGIRPAHFDNPQEIKTQTKSPAFTQYLALLQRFDSMVMLVEEMWLNAAFSSSERQELFAKWRRAFRRLRSRLSLLITETDVRVRRRRAAERQAREKLEAERKERNEARAAARAARRQATEAADGQAPAVEAEDAQPAEVEGAPVADEEVAPQEVVAAAQVVEPAAAEAEVAP